MHKIHNIIKKKATRNTANKQKKEPINFEMELDLDGIFKKQGEQQFYIVNVAGKTASQLYSDIMTHISQLYTHPDKVTDKVPNRSIIINGYANKITQLSISSGYVDIKYRIEINFKEGRFRLNMPEIIEIIKVWPSSNKRTAYDRTDLYQVLAGYAPNFIADFTNYFKTLYSGIAYGLPENDDW